MHFARQLTGAERAMAVAPDGAVLDTHGLTSEMIQAEDFTGFRNIEQAVASNETPHITNNGVLEPEAAPTTNTNFANLRLVVIFTLGDAGFVYVDQYVRNGAIDQETTQRIQQFARLWLADGKTDLSTADMLTQYSTAT